MNLPFMCQVVANQISEASGLLEILSLLSLWYTLAVLEPISCLCFLSITPKNIKKKHRLSHIFNWYKKGILGRKGFRATDFLLNSCATVILFKNRCSKAATRCAL